AERIGNLHLGALTFELSAVVIAIAGPSALAGAVDERNNTARFGERAVAVNLNLGKSCELSAEGADLRARGANENAVALAAHAVGHADQADADLDNLGRFPGRRRSVPAGRLDVDDHDLIQQLCHRGDPAPRVLMSAFIMGG